MSEIKKILDEIASVSGKNDKRATLKKYADNELLKEVIYKAHSPRVKYYIKQIPEYTNKPSVMMDLATAMNNLSKLSDRELTGHDASEYLKEILECLHPDDAFVIEKIIGKNLKIGMDSGYNDVIPDLIEETPYMGAKSYSEKLAKAIFKSGKGAISQIKMDGTYRNAIIQNGEVELVSRQGEVSILDGALFLKQLSQLPDCVLNGELTIDGYDRYEANGMVSSIMDIKKHAEERGEVLTNKKIAEFEKEHGSFEEAINKMRYTVWDMITIEEYFNKKSTRPYNRRLEVLGIALDDESIDELTMVSQVETRIVSDYTEAMSHFQDALARGLEGTILKAMDGEWKDGKPNWQVKMKLEMTIDLRITGLLYGNKGTKNEHVISRLQVESSCGLLKTQPSGMKEAEMKYVTENQESLLGTVVEIRCCGLSQDKTGEWSVLHPSVVEFRTDKNTCDSLESAQEIENMAKSLTV
jgi:DNA ligase-1